MKDNQITVEYLFFFSLSQLKSKFQIQYKEVNYSSIPLTPLNFYALFHL